METLAEYFAKHPEEEEEYLQAYIDQHANDEVIDYPEDWNLREAEYEYSR